MPSFWKVVNSVIEKADILLLLLDARMVAETRNKEVEDKVRRLEKPLIYVVTKCDLVSQKKAELWKKRLSPCVFVSSKDHHGTTLLRQRILIEGKRLNPEWKQYRVGVLGYPNVGKSSLVNAMKGRRSASTSKLSGHTKGMQMIKGDNRILFLDSPGVIPYREKNESKHALIGSTDYSKVKNPDLVVLRMLDEMPHMLQEYFEVAGEGEEFIENVAREKHLLKKGNLPDVDRASRYILKAWQEGNIVEERPKTLRSKHKEFTHPRIKS